MKENFQESHICPQESYITFPPIITVRGTNLPVGLRLIRLYIVMMWRQFSNWRLYSCRRFTFVKKTLIILINYVAEFFTIPSQLLKYLNNKHNVQNINKILRLSKKDRINEREILNQTLWNLSCKKLGS